jgi:hypothetical protein
MLEETLWAVASYRPTRHDGGASAIEAHQAAAGSSMIDDEHVAVRTFLNQDRS